MTRPPDRAALALVLAAALADGCGGSPPPPAAEEAPVRDVLAVERAVARARADLGAALRAGLEGGAELEAALGPSFRGRLPPPDAGHVLADARLSVRRLSAETPGAAESLDAAPFAARLRAYAAGWPRLERFELEFERFLPGTGGDVASGSARLTFAGSPAEGHRARVELRGAVALRTDGVWRLESFELLDGTLVEGAGPRFADVSDAAGLRFEDSAENRALTQAAVDEHRTLAVGGLAVVDWNADGFPDLVATRRAESSVLFENDGRGGFVPRELPLRSPGECPAFLLVLDLDGDGRAELVGTRVLRYEGERASFGIWTRVAGAWRLDESALEFAIPRGRRRISAQTIAPFDADGDGDLDLFIGVYGDALSRGERYDTVDARDGAENYLFMNHGDLRFAEEGRARGLAGTRYTYVGVPFDFDRDGDVDLFEGNDFGPNALWTNDGHGRFRADPHAPFADLSTYSMGASIGDFENDGTWSLYVANMSAPAGTRVVALADDLGARMRAQLASIARGNTLYTRDPHSGAWSERAAALGCAEAGWAWGSLFCDVDGDGDQDLVSTNGFASHSDPGLPDWEPLYWRQVLADARALQRGAPIRDVNADVPFAGSLSGYQRDRLFQNLDGAEGFVEAGWVHGIDEAHDGRCVAPLDVDGDGDLDLALYTLGRLVLWENRGPPTHFARVRLEATRGDPQALGAVVALHAGGVTRRSFVRALDGFQTQVLLDVHYGLGATEHIERLSVDWPAGGRETWRDLPVDRLLRVRQGAPRVVVEPLPRWPDASRPRPLPTRPATLGEGTGPQVVRLTASSDPALVRACFGGAAPALPATFVYAPDGALARAFLYEPAAADVDAVLRALADEPAFPESLVFAGRAALDEHRHREARELFERALAADPSSTPAFDGLARAHLALGDLEAAESAYARAVEVDPDYALGHFNLGVTRVHRGRPEDALPPLERALALGGERVVWCLALGEAAAAAERPLEALAAFERAAAADPGAAQPQLLAGKVLAGLGRYPEARARLTEALRLDPSSSEARRTLRAVERRLAEHP